MASFSDTLTAQENAIGRRFGFDARAGGKPHTPIATARFLFDLWLDQGTDAIANSGEKANDASARMQRALDAYFVALPFDSLVFTLADPTAPADGPKMLLPRNAVTFWDATARLVLVLDGFSVVPADSEVFLDALKDQLADTGNDLEKLLKIALGVVVGAWLLYEVS